MGAAVSALDALARPVGPLPLGAWLLVGAGGLWIARTKSGDAQDGADGTAPLNTVTQVPVPVGAIASPDDAAVILNPIIYVSAPAVGSLSGGTATVPNLPTPTPAPSMAPRPAVSVSRPAVKPAVPTSTVKPVRSYTVRPGDTLWAIGLHYGIAWSRIYTKNQTVIEAAARAHGKRNSDGGHWIYPGTVLVIP